MVSETGYRTGLTRAGGPGRALLTIVTFHRVLTDQELRSYPLPQLAVSIEELAWFVAFFQRHYTCGALGEVHRRWMDGERPERPFLAMTFDDGQLDNFENARPVLDGARAKATFFVPLDAIDRGEVLWHDRLAYALQRLLATDRGRALRLCDDFGGSDGDGESLHAVLQCAKRLTPDARLSFIARIEAAAGGPLRPTWDGSMSWAHLRKLVQTGHEVGSHTCSHPILPLVGDEQLAREIVASKVRLESVLGVDCQSFCYPNGDRDARVEDAVRRAGYVRAVTTGWGPNLAGTDPLRLTRCDMHGKHARSRSGRLSHARTALRLSRWFARLRA
jgi:peptidoglycan/xylan/chitin deacetylase (PgdA/CDA1 family)